jgi:hypothetical protein
MLVSLPCATADRATGIVDLLGQRSLFRYPDVTLQASVDQFDAFSCGFQVDVRVGSSKCSYHGSLPSFYALPYKSVDLNNAGMWSGFLCGDTEARLRVDDAALRQYLAEYGASAWVMHVVALHSTAMLQ